MKQLNIGIIGAGRIGKVHAQSITYNVPTAKVLGITDVFKDGLQELADKYGIEKVYNDYKEMLDTEKLDAVHLCLPHYLHSKVACYAFSKGVNVLTEKPMDVDYESAVNAVETAKKYGVQESIIEQK